MTSYINLYQEQFQIKKQKCSAVHMWTILSVAVFMMFMISSSMAWMNYAGKQRYQALSQQAALTKNKVQELQARLDSQAVDPAIRQAIDEAARELTARRKIMQWVDQSNIKETVLFSDLLEGLGRQRVDGLWMSHIGIENSGDFLHFEGRSRDPKLLPAFLSKLNNEPAYVGREFKKILIVQDETNNNIVNFVISNHKNAEGNLVALEKEFEILN